MNKYFLIIFTLLFNYFLPVSANDTLRALFIGNSYTSVNDLPAVTQAMAAADGRVLTTAVSAPGGFTLQQHYSHAATVGLIQQGNWDFVVLQEQSQLPSFPQSQVTSTFFAYATKLDSLIRRYNPCATTVFYVTWGRKNGDQQNCGSFPPLCTYEGMDSLLTLRYTQVAEARQAALSPVGPLWHFLRDQQPAVELYQADESHPSAAGTFAAACSFYSLFFGANPVNNSYNYMLSAADAGIIKAAAGQIIADSLEYWQRFLTSPTAGFSYSDSASGIAFNNQSTDAGSYFWTFGDGQTSTSVHPYHSYTASGTYQVCLTAISGCDSATYCDTIVVGGGTGISDPHGTTIRLYPNPTDAWLRVTGLQRAGSYVIYNAVGSAVAQGRVSPAADRVDLRLLPPGLYWLSYIDLSGITFTAKFQKR